MTQGPSKDLENSGYLGVHFPELKARTLVTAVKACQTLGIPKEDVKIETDPHVTVRYGFHKDVRKEDVVRALAQLGFSRTSVAQITFGKLGYFSIPQKDVVFVSVPGAPILRMMNQVLRELPGITTFPQYKPHLTLAYVPAGQGQKFMGFPALEGVTVQIKDLIFQNNGEKFPMDWSEVSVGRSPVLYQDLERSPLNLI